MFFLFQYRPSQWRWRRGEARYTAATIHMWFKLPEYNSLQDKSTTKRISWFFAKYQTISLRIEPTSTCLDFKWQAMHLWFFCDKIQERWRPKLEWNRLCLTRCLSVWVPPYIFVYTGWFINCSHRRYLRIWSWEKIKSVTGKPFKILLLLINYKCNCVFYKILLYQYFDKT